MRKKTRVATNHAQIVNYYKAWPKLKAYAKYRKHRKELNQKAMSFRNLRLQRLAYEAWVLYKEERKVINGDVLLRMREDKD
jgi:hypothetical protein